MIRYTEKDARECAKRLADFLGKQFENCWEDRKAKIGCWKLDCNPIYGGCEIEEIINEAGAVTLPFGENRLPPREFCQTINFAIKAIEIDRRSR